MSRKAPSEPVDWERAHKRAMALLELARRHGTHSDKSQHCCGSCRQWTDSIYYVAFDGTPLCPGCADKIGQGPKSDEKRMAARAARGA